MREAYRITDHGGASAALVKQRFEFCLVFDKLKHMKPEERSFLFIYCVGGEGGGKGYERIHLLIVTF